MTTLVMAGSLVQVPASESSASPSAQEGQGDIGLPQESRRFRVFSGFLHVVCRLIVVSECLFSRTNPGPREECCVVFVCDRSCPWIVSLADWSEDNYKPKKVRNIMPLFLNK